MATTPAAKLTRELMYTSSTPTAHVSKGLSEKAALMAFEGLELVIHCHMKATVAEHPIAVSNGG